MGDLRWLRIYPENHVLGVMPSSEHARAAVFELRRRGITDERVHALAPPDIGETFDPLSPFNIAEDALIDYAEALQEGYTVLAVEVDEGDEDDRMRAAEAMRRCGGRLIRFFGRYVVENMERVRVARDPAA